MYVSNAVHPQVSSSTADIALLGAGYQYTPQLWQHHSLHIYGPGSPMRFQRRFENDQYVLKYVQIYHYIQNKSLKPPKIRHVSQNS